MTATPVASAREARRKLGSRATRKRTRKTLKNQRPLAKITADRKAKAKRDNLKAKK